MDLRSDQRRKTLQRLTNRGSCLGRCIRNTQHKRILQISRESFRALTFVATIDFLADWPSLLNKWPGFRSLPGWFHRWPQSPLVLSTVKTQDWRLWMLTSFPEMLRAKLAMALLPLPSPDLVWGPSDRLLQNVVTPNRVHECGLSRDH